MFLVTRPATIYQTQLKTNNNSAQVRSWSSVCTSQLAGFSWRHSPRSHVNGIGTKIGNLRTQLFCIHVLMSWIFLLSLHARQSIPHHSPRPHNWLCIGATNPPTPPVMTGSAWKSQVGSSSSSSCCDHVRGCWVFCATIAVVQPARIRAVVVMTQTSQPDILIHLAIVEKVHKSTKYIRYMHPPPYWGIIACITNWL
jgi:hypothetical protein